jgi:hypothetical protein
MHTRSCSENGTTSFETSKFFHNHAFEMQIYTVNQPVMVMVMVMGTIGQIMWTCRAKWQSVYGIMA